MPMAAIAREYLELLFRSRELAQAVTSQDLAGMARCLTAGADPNYRRKFEGSLLSRVVEEWTGPEKCEAAGQLLKFGGNPNLRNDEYRTPLSLALEKNDEPMVQILRRHGAVGVAADPFRSGDPIRLCSRGAGNPERVSHAYYENAVKTGFSAYAIGESSRHGHAFDRPIWCYRRFGTSATRLSDGSFVEIAGEHEDFYDPDFWIYNDVVHFKRDGQLGIYFYSKEAFAPTDFQSATLVGHFIYLIGCLGYAGERMEGHTPVYRLDTRTFAMTPVAADGEAPGWIWEHLALYDRPANEIHVFGGKVMRNGRMADNDRLHVLNMDQGRWRCEGAVTEAYRAVLQEVA